MLFTGLPVLSRRFTGSTAATAAGGRAWWGAGTVHGGEYANIIADYVEIKGTIRACFAEDFEELTKRLRAALKTAEEESGTKIELRFLKPPVLRFLTMPVIHRRQRISGGKFLENDFFWRERMRCFCPATMRTGIFRKCPGYSWFFLLRRNRQIRCTIRNFSWMRRFFLTVWRCCAAC